MNILGARLAVHLKVIHDCFQLTDGCLLGITTKNACSNHSVTGGLQSTLEASGIEWPVLRNYLPCMAHIIQLALRAFRCCLGVKGRTKSWESHEHNQQFGEKSSIAIGKSLRIQKEGNGRIKMLSAIRPGLAIIIEKVLISIDFESPENDHHIAETACCIEFCWNLVVETRSLSVKMPKYQSQDCLWWMGRHGGYRNSSHLSDPVHYKNIPMSCSKIKNIVITSHSSQLRMNGPLSSMGWKYWGHSDSWPCGCRWGIRSHFLRSSQSTMTCSITWMTLCELWLRRRLHEWKICTML